MKPAHGIFALLFYAGMFALIFFGGELAAQRTDSRWLAMLFGLVVGIAFIGLSAWAEKVMLASSVDVSTEETAGEEVPKPIETFGIIAVLSVALVMALSSFGYSGIPTAFSAGLLGGYLISLVVAPLFEKSRLQS